MIDRERADAALREHGASARLPRAFDGTIERLPAIDPPIGMVESLPHARSRPWISRRDLLLLFTDGVSDARNRFGVRLGEQPVLDIVQRYRIGIARTRSCSASSMSWRNTPERPCSATISRW